jgi:phospholipase/carboxylesterase
MLTEFSGRVCLGSKFVDRHARRYGGLLLFCGCLICPPNSLLDYEESLAGTSVFLGYSDIDPYIPLERVEEITIILTNLGAAENQQIYPGTGYTIVQDEINQANKILKTDLPE